MMTQTETKCYKSFSWKAVIVGAFVAFGLLFLFNLLTVGGGLSAYTKTEGGLENLVGIAYLWTLVGNFLMLFIAGAVTSTVLTHRHLHLDHYDGCDSVLHGFVMWVVYLLLSLAFLSHVSSSAIPQNFGSVASVSKENKDTVAASVTAKAAVRADRISNNVVTPGDNKAQDNAVIPAKERAEAHQIGLATLAAFFVFFVEVIGATFGAYCARDVCFRECRKEVYVKKEVEIKKV